MFPSGNMALLMKTKGNARKLIIATSESTCFTEKATAVKRQPNPNVTEPESSKHAKEVQALQSPRQLATRLEEAKPTMNVSTAMNMAFTKFCIAPEKNIDALDIGALNKELR